MEPINTGPELYLFGAGHVGQALCQVLDGTVFSIHLIDDREEWVFSDKISSQVIRHPCDWKDFQWNPETTFVAIMTHRHDLDQEILEKALKHEIRYVGMIGSASKWEKLKERLTQRGVSTHVLSKVKCPIGLNIGGKSPKEIAISIASELLQIYHETEKS